MAQCKYFGQTAGWTHGQAKTNMPFQLFRSWGINTVSPVFSLLLFYPTLKMLTCSKVMHNSSNMLKFQPDPTLNTKLAGHKRLTSSPKGNDAHLSAIINLKELWRYSRAVNSTVSGQIWPKLELIQALMNVRITGKIGLKTTKKRWKHHFPHRKSIKELFRCSRADYSILCGPIWSKF